jgi:HAD superfamily hydrolase (TIGR01509 family)
MMLVIKAILFDMDGILFDSERAYLEANMKLLRSLGYQGPQQGLYAAIGSDMDGLYTVMEELLEHRFSRQEIEEAVAAYYQAHPLSFRDILFPDIPDTMRRLHQAGLQTALCSGSPVKDMQASLAETNLAGAFDVLLSTDEVARPKPAPDIYLRALALLHRKAEEAVVYEDSTAGIAAGKAAGMRVIARQDTRYGQDQSAADFLVKDSREMASIVLAEEKHERNVSN